MKNKKEGINLTHKQFDFDIIKAHIQAILNAKNYNDIYFHLTINNALEQIKVVFWKEYIGKHQQKEIDFYVPKTWKDHFKKTYRNNRLMKLWLKKHPIKTKRLRFKINKIHIFPEVEVPHDNKFQKHFNYLEVMRDE